MVNYMDSKIYTIRCRIDETLIYVGSTTQKLTQRLAKHRSDCKMGRCYSLYKYIVSDDWREWYIELVQNFPCNSKEELEKREGEVIREIGTINKRIAGRTKREYYEDNVENLKEKHKEYREGNAEKLKEYKKEHYENNKDKIKENSKKYYEMNAYIIKEKIKIHRVVNADKIKETKKKYYEDNAEKIKEKNKKYREDNADKIKEYKKTYYEDNAEKNKEKICCDICGAFSSKNHLVRHQKTKKCTDIKSKNYFLCV